MYDVIFSKETQTPVPISIACGYYSTAENLVSALNQKLPEKDTTSAATISYNSNRQRATVNVSDNQKKLVFDKDLSDMLGFKDN